MPTDRNDLFARVIALALEFPRVEVGSSGGEPVLKANKKFMARMWPPDGETLMVQCANVDEKEFFLASEPEVFVPFLHYKDSRAVLVRLPVVTDMRLRELLEQAWRNNVPAKLIRELEASRANRTE
jgi:hypothetical protein